MTADKAANVPRAASAAALLFVLPLVSAIVGCGLPGSGDSPRASVSEDAQTDDADPTRAGWVLVLRDGDLRLLSGHWERQVTHTGDYRTGALTGGGGVIGLRSTDGGGSSLVHLEVGETAVTQTAEVALAREPPDWGPYPGYLAVSPDGTRVLAGGVLVELESGRRTDLAPGGGSAVWSPDGSRVAYLARAGDWDPDSQTVRRYDLWVEDVAGGAAARRIATGMMRSFGLYGRYAESIAWSGDGEKILALSAAGAEWIELRGPGYGVAGPANNRLVRIDVDTGDERVLASSVDLHQRLGAGVNPAADQVVVSAASTPGDPERAAFMAMDYERAYGIGLLDADGRLERLIVEIAPDRHTVHMSTPVWSPDGARLAYFGWYMTSRMPFIDVLDVATGAIDRVWESTEYRKPGHWDISPDGKWVWIVVSTYRPDDPRLERDLSMLASVDRPGHVELVPGIVLDWCCVRPGEVRAP